ncbi:MAG TPA: efflux RND transporter periplasmic adaptor subunit [Aquifex aeolicus]|nr:efflux RND transporter periplasmic adaptor subunit [Aquificales bacterium]HIQ26359.1 efflux RND transporter periplasmic adaptor subunit [Aquifex aeolicus]
MKAVIKWGGFTGVMAFTVAWLGGFFHSKVAPAEVHETPQKVSGLKIQTVKAEEKVVTSKFAGTVVAQDSARISTRLAGFVEKVLVDVGDRVKKGQLLMVIDPKDLMAQKESLKHQIEATKAQAWFAKRTYERLLALRDIGGVTEQQLDMAKAQCEALENAVKSLTSALKTIENNLRYAEIKAPFEGVVSLRPVNEGDFVGPGSLLMVIDKPPYEVVVYLPERLFGKIKVGQPLKVEVNETTVVGKVKTVSPSIDPMSRTFMVKVSIPENCKLGSGKSAYVEVPDVKSEKTILIPQKAVFKWGDFTAVYVVDEQGILHLRFVRLGLPYGNKVEVLSGLRDGEKIVIEGMKKACDGCAVSNINGG